MFKIVLVTSWRCGGRQHCSANSHRSVVRISLSGGPIQRSKFVLSDAGNVDGHMPSACHVVREDAGQRVKQTFDRTSPEFNRRDGRRGIRGVVPPAERFAMVTSQRIGQCIFEHFRHLFRASFILKFVVRHPNKESL